MQLLARPTSLVHRDYGRLGALHKAPDPRSGPRSVVVYAGGAPIATYPGLGAFGLDSIIGGITSIIAGDQAASAERYKARKELQATQIAAQAQETGYKYMFAAEQAKSSADVTKSVLEANAALSALRTQRMAAIDAQATQLVANTQNGIFRLASTGVAEAGAEARDASKRTMWGAVLVAAVIAVAIANPKIGFGKKKKRAAAASSAPTPATAMAAEETTP